MNCKHCGAENANEAQACHSCGKEIAEQKCCPNCKRPIIEGALICDCGARVDGRKFCPCGALLKNDAKVCPDCGREVVDQQERQRRQLQAQQKKEKQERVLMKTEVGLSIFGAIFCLVGLTALLVAALTPLFTVNFDPSSVSESDTIFFNPYNMFYHYFYQAFANLPKSDAQKFVVYFIAVAVIANLFVCAAMFVVALVKTIKSSIRGTKVNVVAHLVVALVLNIAVVLLMHANSVISYTISLDENTPIYINVGIGTLVAYVVAVIALVATLSIRVMQKEKQIDKRRSVANLAFSITAAVLLIVAAGLLSTFMFKIEVVDRMDGYSKGTLFGVSTMFSFFDTIDIARPFYVSMASFAVFICLVPVLLAVIGQTICYALAEKKDKKPVNFVLLIVVAALFVMLLVLNIVLVNLNELSNIGLTTQAILAPIFAALGIIFALLARTTHPVQKAVKVVGTGAGRYG